jgi:hypothetical protein
MVTIVRLTDKACFLCATKEDTVEVRFKDRTFSGVVCKEHLFQLLKRRVKPAKDQKGDEPVSRA